MYRFRRLCAAVALTCFGAVAGAEDALESLAKPQTGYIAKRVSSYDKTGGNVDCLVGIEPGQTRVLAEIDGPGIITHIWCTINAEKFYGRKVVLRMYWDDEDDPSVLAPLNDFFAMGHGLDAPLASLPITTTADGRSKNSFFKMPFNRKARIEITNEGLEPIGAFYYYIDYRQYQQPFPDPVYFHARYRQEYPAVAGKDYLVCKAQGRGHYVGTVLSYESHYAGWWGEGDDKFYIDGETTPSLHGTGTEDYLNDAWGIWKGSSPFYGTSIFEGTPYIYPVDTRYTSYRWHITDPIPFTKSLRFDIEHYGVGRTESGADNGFMERFDNISSVAYWYQVEPHEPMEPLTPVHKRLSKHHGDEKALLGFLHDAANTASTGSITDVRSQYNSLTSGPLYEIHRDRVISAMAGAELRAGNDAAALKLVEDRATPFVARELAADEEIAELLQSRLPQGTPLLVQHNDGSAVRVEKEGLAAITTGNGKPYIYFAMPSASPFKNRQADLVAEITYFNSGLTTDTLRVHYNASGAGQGDPYRASEAVKKEQALGWHTTAILLPQARFSGGQNGAADFRISNEEEGVEVIGSVVIREQ